MSKKKSSLPKLRQKKRPPVPNATLGTNDLQVFCESVAHLHSKIRSLMKYAASDDSRDSNDPQVLEQAKILLADFFFAYLAFLNTDTSVSSELSSIRINGTVQFAGVTGRNQAAGVGWFSNRLLKTIRNAGQVKLLSISTPDWKTLLGNWHIIREAIGFPDIYDHQAVDEELAWEYERAQALRKKHADKDGQEPAKSKSSAPKVADTWQSEGGIKWNELATSALLSAADIAEKLGQPGGNVERFLRYQRKVRPFCFVEDDSPQKGSPRYLHKMPDILPPLKEWMDKRLKKQFDG
jgi:hypothetical protein